MARICIDVPEVKIEKLGLIELFPDADVGEEAPVEVDEAPQEE